MSGVKHTPGPWEVAYLDENGQSVVKGEHTEIATCWHHCVGSIEAQMHANARLIAAAPDLLEALIEAAETLERCRYSEQAMAQKCRDVIAKATQP